MENPNGRVVQVHPTLSYVHSISKAHFSYRVYRDLIDEMAEKCPDKVAIIFPNDGDLHLTFGEIKRRACILAQNLLHLNFKKGDRISIATNYTHHMIILAYAASYIGVVLVYLNTTFKRLEFETLVKKTQSKGILLFDRMDDKSFVDIFREICPELSSCEKGQLESKNLPDLKHIIVVKYPFGDESDTKAEDLSGCWMFEELGDKRINEEKEYEWPIVNPDDNCFITLTSGTTGLPKGVCHTFFSMLNSLYITVERRRDENQPDLKMCFALPLLHIGLQSALLYPYLSNTVIVLPFKNFRAIEAVQAVAKYKCMFIGTSPRMLHEMITESDGYDMSSVIFTFVGGSQLTRDLVLKAHKRFESLALFFNGYGMSEIPTVCNTFVNLELLGDKEPTSVGKPGAYLECKIVDESTGDVVPLNHDGILMIRSYNTMVCYWDEPVKTAETKDKNGWLNTGDMFSMNDKGELHFKSRQKETIKIYDHSLYPLEVEIYLSNHPNIEESCVFGIPQNDYETKIGAWIKLKDPQIPTTEEEIFDFCKKTFAEFKAPTVIKFVESFPRTPLGKYKRAEMAEYHKKAK